VRIQEIRLSWFRGSSNEAVLNTDLKSVVIYGKNASGKSTFVDGLEYIVGKGRIRHLAHEYSGSRQEKAIRNTATPDDENSRIIIRFDKNREVCVEINADGVSTVPREHRNLVSIMQNWNVESHLLRQDEVARFILYTKGQKYSALLPLLGLDTLEQAGENLHQLSTKVTERSSIEEHKTQLNMLSKEALTVLESLESDQVFDDLTKLAAQYNILESAGNLSSLSESLAIEIDKRIGQIEPELERYLVIKEMHDEESLNKMNEMIDARKVAEKSVDLALDIRISVLEPAERFITIIKDSKEEISCPACGQKILAGSFMDHVKKELESLREAREARKTLRDKCNAFVRSLINLQEKAKDEKFTSWLNLPEQDDLSSQFSKLSKVAIPQQDHIQWNDEQIAEVYKILLKIYAILDKQLKNTPPSIEELVKHKEYVKASGKIPEIQKLQTDIDLVQSLINFLENSENAVRNEIKARTEKILEKISDDVKELWSKLHPDELIEDIKLYVQNDADKAIDIGLRFFGTDQPSPRLTLSEGYRNCLGLCIFLSLARLDKSDDPIILDDIVSSFDREHRGMLTSVILDEFEDRQVLLFTHDREWYSELCHRLPSANWKFMTLMPWKDPSVGIRWAESTYTFDDARALINVNTEACGNRARAIMDVQLSIIAEKLGIMVHHLRGDRNDHRTCIEFLEQIINEAPKRFRKKSNGTWQPYEESISEWIAAKALLIAWGDRASHTGSLVPSEAEALIKICEKSLDCFKCDSCGEYVWIANQMSRKRLQCACGDLQWRYE